MAAASRGVTQTQLNIKESRSTKILPHPPPNQVMLNINASGVMVNVTQTACTLLIPLRFTDYRLYDLWECRCFPTVVATYLVSVFMAFFAWGLAFWSVHSSQALSILQKQNLISSAVPALVEKDPTLQRKETTCIPIFFSLFCTNMLMGTLFFRILVLFMDI